jgi:hypothetical protein
VTASTKMRPNKFSSAQHIQAKYHDPQYAKRNCCEASNPCRIHLTHLRSVHRWSVIIVLHRQGAPSVLTERQFGGIWNSKENNRQSSADIVPGFGSGVNVRMLAAVEGEPSNKSNPTVATNGIDIGKNPFHVVGPKIVRKGTELPLFQL